MSLLAATGLAFRYSCQPDPIFEQVAFEINPDDRVGLVGPNGSGKTTLLRILTGELKPHEGAVVSRRQLRVSYIPQENPVRDEESLREYVLRANPDIAQIKQEIHSLESRLDDVTSASLYASLLNTFEEQGGFRFEAEVERVLDGLGFERGQHDLRAACLSSGQRARAGLAKLLLAPADLLLIDEPTNHLDIAAQDWLEEYLSRVSAAYLLVSHDRLLLSRATTRTFELRRKALFVHEGNYEFYVEQRALREKQEWARFAAEERRVVAARQAAERRMSLSRQVSKAPAGVRSGHDFYQHKAAKLARTARILRERVDREPRASKPWQETPIPQLDFPDIAQRPGIVLRAEALAKTYGHKRLFENLNFYVRAGSRWAILGPNGCGKSTLLRILMGLESPDYGTVDRSAHAQIGYYAQENENLEPSKSPLQLCLEVLQDETRARTILGCLRLRGDEATGRLELMSSGQRATVALARLLLSGANLLLLDELTNYLDIEKRESVEDALRRYPGTILFVTHDRSFVKALADELLDLSAFAGSFSKPA